MKYETYFKLVLATGLRRGEACGLKWSDINWRKRTIHVQRGVVKLSHQESITKDPKTSSGDQNGISEQRDVPTAQGVAERMRVG